MKSATPSGDPSGAGTSGGDPSGAGTSGGATSGEPIVWPEELGSVGQYLVTAGKEFTKLVDGLDRIYALPYTDGARLTKDNGDDVTWPFLQYFMKFKDASVGLTTITGEGIGARGYSTTVTDRQHGAAETTNTDNANFFHG